MSFLGVVFVVLLILKLLGVISISWWLVFLPLLLIPIILFLVYAVAYWAATRG